MKMISWFLLMLLVITVCTTCSADEIENESMVASTTAKEVIPIGFGYVNGEAVALRKEMNRDVITRLPQDSCVWVRDEKKDEKGVSW